VGPSATSAPAAKRKLKPPEVKAWDKLLLLVGVAVAVAAVLIVPGIVNRGGQNPVAEAAETTLHWPGARMSFTATGTGQAGAVTMEGAGVMNGETNRALIEISATANQDGAGREYKASQIDDGTNFYFHSPELSQTIGGGAPWLLIRGDALGELAQQSGSGGFMKVGGVSSPSGPREQLNLLESASNDMRTIGREDVRGSTTTHYAGTIDFRRLVDQYRDKLSDRAIQLFDQAMRESQPTETVDVWIDDQGLIRRESATVTAAGSTRLTTVVEFYDFGIHPAIDVPDPREVHDITPLLQQALDPLLKS
jgi:hypothetical protein